MGEDEDDDDQDDQDNDDQDNDDQDKDTKVEDNTKENGEGERRGLVLLQGVLFSLLLSRRSVRRLVRFIQARALLPMQVHLRLPGARSRAKLKARPKIVFRVNQSFYVLGMVSLQK